MMPNEEQFNQAHHRCCLCNKGTVTWWSLLDEGDGPELQIIEAHCLHCDQETGYCADGDIIADAGDPHGLYDIKFVGRWNPHV